MDRAPGLESAFDAPFVELDRAPIELEGALPPFVRGTAYWIGPARFGRGALRYRNWLDGDGMAVAVRLGADGARVTTRHVQTEKWRAEEAEGRAIFRTFGTSFPGDQLRRGRALASPANVSLVPFAGRLLAFGEQGLPYELDPVDLSTRGTHDFGCLNEVTPFSAHPAIDPESGEMFQFGVSFAAAAPLLHLFRFDAGGELRMRTRIPLDRPYSLHDFSLSARYAVFHLSPYLLDVRPMLESGATVLDGLTWRPELGARLLIADRETGEPVCDVAAGAGYCLHQVNAFERGDDELVIDLIELEEPAYPDYQVLPALFERVRPSRCVRYVVAPRAARLVAREERAPGPASDFPVVDPALAGRAATDFWRLAISTTGVPGRKFFDRLQRIDAATGAVVSEHATASPVVFGSEPLFVPESPGSPGGVVLCHAYDATAGASSILALDALALDRPPLARLRLAAPIPLCFHGAFARASADGGPG